MGLLVAAETVLLVLLLLLVAGLLRSNAEILRRLGPADGEGEERPGLEVLSAPAPGAAPERGAEPPARDVAGVTLGGDAVQVGLAGDAPPTLLAFLSSGCATCRAFWDGFGAGEPELPEGVRLVIVPEDGSRESPSRLRRLAGAGGADLPVILSSAAWSDYAVPASPYFVLSVAGRIRGEGSAEGWPQLTSLLADALDDERLGGGGPRRARRVDATLAAAGVAAGHPSLDPPGEIPA